MKILYCSTGKICLYICYLIFLYFLLCAWRPARGQTPYTIQGRMLSAENQEPLVGASVLLKGTTNGTNTNKNGYFSITTTEIKITLALSFIGYRSLDTLLSLPLKEELILTLQQDFTMLEELKVSTGYWETSKRLSTGNIAKVDAKAISKQPISNPLQALDGRLPGVFVQQTTGVPGGGINIEIRGRNSLRSEGNYPMYVVDGIPFLSTSLNSSVGASILRGGSPINNINPSDIASIEVLKDADATAIYGARGANGVVLITTKRASSGKTKLDLDVYKGWGTVSRKMKLLNTTQWLQMRHEAFRNDNALLGATDYDLNGSWDTTRYTNWQKELIGGTARITRTNASLSGGNHNTNFMFGVGYYKETTVYPSDFGDRKLSSILNLNHTSTNKRLSIRFSANYQVDDNNLPRTDLSTIALELSPVAPRIFNDNGELNWQNSTWTNPLSYIQQKYKGKTKNMVSSLNFNFAIAKGISLKANFGYGNNQLDELGITPIKSYDPAYAANVQGASSKAINSWTTWTAEPQFEFKKHMAKGEFTALVGTSFQQNRLEGISALASGYTSDAMLENLQAAPKSTITSNETDYRFNSFFARINYLYTDRYLFNITARKDGSSRFGPDRQFANFGAIGVAWIFSEEDFVVKKIKFLAFGKLRASYGITGSDQIGDYGFLDTYSATPHTYDNITGFYPSSLFNADYSWEKTRKFELALETGFLNGRVTFDLSYYRNVTSDQLIGYALPAVTGFSSIQANSPAQVSNSGLETVVSLSFVKKEGFTWNTTMNISFPQNKLLAFPNIETSAYLNTYSVGKSIYKVKKLQSMGVDPQTGIYSYFTNESQGTPSLTRDGKFNKQVGSHFYGGVQNSIGYKRFSLDLLVQFVKQTGWDYVTGFYNQPGTRFNNQPVQVMDRWQSTGDQKNIQKFSQVFTDVYQGYNNIRNNGDNAITDCSFIRLKNVYLSYELPAIGHKQSHFGNGSIFIQGQNLYTISRFVGADPQNNTFGGVRYLPSLRVLSFGLKLTI